MGNFLLRNYGVADWRKTEALLSKFNPACEDQCSARKRSASVSYRTCLPRSASDTFRATSASAFIHGLDTVIIIKLSVGMDMWWLNEASHAPSHVWKIKQDWLTQAWIQLWSILCCSTGALVCEQDWVILYRIHATGTELHRWASGHWCFSKPKAAKFRDSIL